ncbi:PREDICTED: myeloma-overexpressed gene 2 protein isoform X1 [Mandrillus leucophaeus]|uniref:myeloma-overexpressed gene 2 protein isoform X1 n=1 Tax=Mandrillus leucophaeus TaxID=9568 RepID=UPI0005F3D13B|nr:PREDICTED: myeloma-overexpressed gene 2 protein isoform X1 [Mandrillus leucophaeus]
MGAAPRLPAPRRANPGFSELLVKGGHRPRREVCALARGTRRRSLRVECLLGAPTAPGNTLVDKGVAFAALRWRQHPVGARGGRQHRALDGLGSQ